MLIRPTTLLPPGAGRSSGRIVARLLAHTRVALRGGNDSQLPARHDAHVVQHRTATRDGEHVLRVHGAHCEVDGAHRLHAVHDVPKHGVALDRLRHANLVGDRRDAEGYVELAAVVVRAVAAAHDEHARALHSQLARLVLERLPVDRRAVAPAARHEVAAERVLVERDVEEARVLVREALLACAQRPKVLGGLGAQVGPQLEHDALRRLVVHAHVHVYQRAAGHEREAQYRLLLRPDLVAQVHAQHIRAEDDARGTKRPHCAATHEARARLARGG
mmetsp:Transcript_4762/g.17279  ORF Transcript_4762/g.17279 Transcript_4762/m.17279 type:complete len:275 (+) Transcript_4762:6756-7580(+)